MTDFLSLTPPFTFFSNKQRASSVLSNYNELPTEKFNELNKALVSQRLMLHKDQELRALVACCVADVLRIYAPEAPYDEDQIRKIFNLFISELSGITDLKGASFQHCFRLLESLSMVDTFLILVEMEEHELLHKSFTKFFLYAESDLSNRVESLFLDIMYKTIDELETVPEDLLDLILGHMVPPSSTKRPHAFRLASSLVQRSHARLEVGITKFIRENYIVEGSKPSKTGLIRKREQMASLIEVLAVRCPDTLLPVIPQLQEMLETEDKNQRIETVELFGDIFSSSGSVVAREFEELFMSFIRRFNDMAEEIREYMCNISVELFPSNINHAEALLVQLEARMRDRVEKVRRAAVAAVCNISMENPERVSKDVLVTLRARTKDKKLNVRRETLVQLAGLFSEHCASFWKNANPLPTSGHRNFQFIPSAFCHAYAHGDPYISLAAESLFEEKILDRKFTLEERSMCLVGINASFDKVARTIFFNMLKCKREAAMHVMKLIGVNKTLNESRKDTRVPTAEIEKLEKHAKYLSDLILRRLPDGAKSTDTLSEIFQWKDRNVITHLKTLCSPTSHYSQIVNAKKELQRITNQISKPASILMKYLSTRLSMSLLSFDAVPVLFSEIKDSWNDKVKRLRAVAAISLVHAATEPIPHMLSDSYDDLAELMQVDDSSISNLALCMLSFAKGGDLSSDHVQRNVNKLLHNLCIEGNEYQNKFAVRCLDNLYENDVSEPLLARVLEDAMKGLTFDDIDILLSSLVTIREIAKTAPAVFFEHHTEIVDFITDKLLPTRLFPMSEEERKEDEEGWLEVQLDFATAKTKALKTVVHFLHSLNDEGLSVLDKTDDIIRSAPKQASKNVERIAAPLLKLLISILHAEGDLKPARTPKASDASSSSSSSSLDGGELAVLPEEVADILYLGAAKSTLKLVGQNRYYLMLRPVYFNILALSAHSETMEVRQKVVQYIFNLLGKNRINARFCVILALAASDPNTETKSIAKKGLSVFLRRKRQQCQQQQTLGFNPTTLMWPEHYLADLVHMLAHHPDYSHDTESYKYFQAMIQFFIDALLEGQSESNFTLILNVLNTIKAHVDVERPNSPAIYELAELGLLVIRTKFKAKEWQDNGVSKSSRPLRGSIYRKAPADKVAALVSKQFLPLEYVQSFEARHNTLSTPSKRRKNRKSISVNADASMRSVKSPKANKSPAAKEKKSGTKKRKSMTSDASRRKSLPRSGKANVSYVEMSGSEVDYSSDEEEDEMVERKTRTPSSSSKRKSPMRSIAMSSDDDEEEDSEVSQGSPSKKLQTEPGKENVIDSEMDIESDEEQVVKTRRGRRSRSPEKTTPSHGVRRSGRSRRSAV